MRWLALWLSLTLAGCAAAPQGAPHAADGHATTDPSGPIVQDPTLSNSAAPSGPGAGQIRGRVLDDEARPVSGARVGLLTTPLIAETPDSGEFFFDRVAPGTYRVAAERIGYYDAASQVTVSDGEAARVDIRLVPLPATPEPYFRVLQDDGYIGCNLVTPVVTSSTDYCADPNTRLFHFFNVTTGLTGTVTEFHWTTSGPLQSPQMSVNVYWENSINDRWVNMKTNQSKGPSPIKVVRDDYENVTEKARVKTGLLPKATDVDNPVVFVYQQRFTVYMTAFYLGYPIPVGYTAKA